MDVKLTCRVAPLGMALCNTAAVVENISRSGILLRWSNPLELAVPCAGELLAIEIDLPANRVYGRKCIHCRATVVRVAQSDGEHARVAVTIDQIEFRDFRQAAAGGLAVEYGRMM